MIFHGSHVVDVALSGSRGGGEPPGQPRPSPAALGIIRQFPTAGQRDYSSHCTACGLWGKCLVSFAVELLIGKPKVVRMVRPEWLMWGREEPMYMCGRRTHRASENSSDLQLPYSR